MGCWKATCSVSNLPIFANEKVRGFFIAKNTFGGGRMCHANSFAYSTGTYYPRGVPLQGRYDEYGRIEKIKVNLNYKIVMDQFRADLIDREPDEYGIVGRISKDIGMDELIDEITGSTVQVKAYDGKTAEIGLWMVREDVYQALVNVDLAGTWHSQPINRKKIYDDGRSVFRKMQENAMLRQRAEQMETGPEQQVALRNLWKTLSDLDMDMEMAGHGIFSQMFRGGTVSGSSPRYYSSWLSEAFYKGLDHKSEEAVELLNEMADFAMFQIMMHSMRKAYAPQAGSGSQDDDLQGQVAVAKVVLAANKKQQAEIRKQQDEERRAEKARKA